MKTLKFSLKIFLLFLLFTSCARAGSRPLYYHPEFTKKDPVSLIERVQEIEREDFDNIRLETIAKNKLSTHHLVVIRDAEPLHYHAKHDGWAMVLKGKGEFILGEKRFQIHPGAGFYIPRKVPHQAIRRGREPLAAFVIFTPPYDGKDTVPVHKK